MARRLQMMCTSFVADKTMNGAARRIASARRSSTRLPRSHITDVKEIPMSEQIAQSFIDALARLESERDLAPIVATFADTCDVGNVLVPEFWTEYREAFGEVRSSFRNIVVSDGRAALEWTTEGTSPSGEPFRYDGVSILEVEEGRIARFRAYFDPASLGRQLQGH
jgi:hypothetical protein